MIDRVKENVIEWIDGDKVITCTFSQRKFINRIRRMSEKHPKLVVITAENSDGSIMCKLPLNALHLTIYNNDNKGFRKDLDSGEDTEDDI